MSTTAGQTAGPNLLAFFEVPQGDRLKKNSFSPKIRKKKKFFYDVFKFPGNSA